MVAVGLAILFWIPQSADSSQAAKQKVSTTIANRVGDVRLALTICRKLCRYICYMSIICIRY
jgi:hypothetical protein